MYVVASLMAGYDDPPPAPNARYFPHLLRPDLQPLPPPPSPPQPTASSPGAITPTPTRRARGRPPGSKNKPKAPILVTRDAPNSLRSHVLEFASGTDILLSLSNYARLRGRGLSVLSGSGTVSDVSIRQPGGASLLTLRGKFEILSLTGTVLPPPAPPGSGGIAIFMAGGHGQVVGGSAAGRLVAAGTVVLMAASFANAVFERLPVTEEVEEGGGEGQVQTASQSSGVTGSGGGSGSGLIGVVGGSRNGNSNVGSLPFGGELLGGWGGSGVRHQF